MFILLSPAKKLLNDYQPYSQETTLPALIDPMNILVNIMKTKSVQHIAQLMDLSNDLALINYKRYQDFDPNDFNEHNAYPAILLFQGDVYQELQANAWTNEDLKYAQQHLGILSGLYGLLRPMDRIQPYRLEMGVRLANPQGHALYDFWREPITKLINQQLEVDKNPVLINLASVEYFKAVDEKRLKSTIVTVNFYENKNGRAKMIGIYAKKARGMMAKYLILNRVDTIEGIKQFAEAGYQFNENTSSATHLDFTRK